MKCAGVHVVSRAAAISIASQNHTHLHTDTGTKHQRDTKALTSRPRHTQAQASKRQASGKRKQAANLASTAVTDITRPSRPTAAHLGAHGDGGGPIDLEAHEIQVSTQSRVMVPLCSRQPIIERLDHDITTSMSTSSTGQAMVSIALGLADIIIEDK